MERSQTVGGNQEGNGGLNQEKQGEKKGRRGGGEKERRPIRMMESEPQWNYVEALRDTPVTVRWGTLIDLAPEITGGIARSLVRERLKRGAKAGRVVEEESDDEIGIKRGVNRVQWVEGVPVKLDGKEIIKEPKGMMVNFYTKGEVYVARWDPIMGRMTERTFELSRILIDGGSVVNLIPLELARKMGLELHPTNDLRIRTATNEIRSIDFAAQLILKVANVTCAVRVYCMAYTVSYSLLLGRRWLQQCQAKGDYKNHTYVIFDSKGRGHEVDGHLGSGVRSRKQPEIILNPDKKMRSEFELEEDEYTELFMGSIERTNAILAKVMNQSETEEVASIAKVNANEKEDWQEELSEESEKEEQVEEKGRSHLGRAT
ncbi:hypothetical protein DFH27DRAFT_528665 [Peziza echinospora]|nr:hypothetical protein DFH27DRAFT_528665 [Peziza echinospora]